MTHTFRLKVSDRHRLYVEASGNTAGIPVVLLHGGPGGLPDPRDLDFFPSHDFLRISFHQRGSGLSRPLGELRENTLDYLVTDIEQIRRHLGINKWVVFGGSFGSALGIHYAQTHRAACRMLIVHSVLLGRPGFETWDFDGSCSIAPESWLQLVAEMPGPPSKPLQQRCFDAILRGGRDGARATRAWYARSAVLSCLSPDFRPSPRSPTIGQMRASARLSAHYWQNRLFLPPGALLDRSETLSGLPGAIMHGADDRNCLAKDAIALAACWRGVELKIIQGAGHSSQEPRMAKAIEEFVRPLNQLDFRLF